MSEDSARARVTLSTETIHNPKEPRHFMRIKKVPGRVRILRNGEVLAETDAAVRVIEAGRDIYDPVIYVPADDVTAPLQRFDKETFCPIKGNATYFNLTSDGEVTVPEIAWSYEDALDCATELKGRIAFYARHVVIEEHPAEAAA